MVAVLSDLAPLDVFDADYLYFYETFQTAAVNEVETELVARLLDLEGTHDVLDACCGAGRIANRLAARGHRVTGIDSNPLFCRLGRSEAAAAAVTVDYRCEDICHLADEASFDVVLSWFSSFGYWDDRTNVDILRRFRRALRPGGQLLLDLPNPALLMRQLGPGGEAVRRVRRAGEHDLMEDHIGVDLESSELQVSRRIVRNGADRTVHLACRLYTPSELSARLKRTRFGLTAILGDDGHALHADSTRQLLLATAI